MANKALSLLLTEVPQKLAQSHLNGLIVTTRHSASLFFMSPKLSLCLQSSHLNCSRHCPPRLFVSTQLVPVHASCHTNLCVASSDTKHLVSNRFQEVNSFRKFTVTVGCKRLAYGCTYVPGDVLIDAFTVPVRFDRSMT